jgi:hypothetical protein
METLKQEIVPAKPEPTALEKITGDATYGGAFVINPKLVNAGIPAVFKTGKAVGAVSFVAAKMGITVSKDTTLAVLRSKHDKDTIKRWLKVKEQMKHLRAVHSRQITALVAADANWGLTVRGGANKKGQFTRLNIGAKFQTSEKETKMSVSAERDAFRAKLAELGVVV